MNPIIILLHEQSIHDPIILPVLLQTVEAEIVQPAENPIPAAEGLPQVIPEDHTLQATVSHALLMCHHIMKEVQVVVILPKEEAVVVPTVHLLDQAHNRPTPDHRLRVHRAIMEADVVILASLRQVVHRIHQAVVHLHILQAHQAHQALEEAMHLHHVQVQVAEVQVQEDHTQHREEDKALLSLIFLQKYFQGPF